MWNSNSTDFSQEEHSPAYFGRHQLCSSLPFFVLEQKEQGKELEL